MVSLGIWELKVNGVKKSVELRRMSGIPLDTPANPSEE
jgi:hypothetical protein